jgi:hypothetical protein
VEECRRNKRHCGTITPPPTTGCELGHTPKAGHLPDSPAGFPESRGGAFEEATIGGGVLGKTDVPCGVADIAEIDLPEPISHRRGRQIKSNGGLAPLPLLADFVAGAPVYELLK